MDLAAAAAPPRRRRIIPVLVILVGLAGLAWWLLRDHEEDGVVAAMRWSHTTQLQRWQDVVRSGWQQDLAFRAGVAPIQGAGEVAAVLVTHCTAKHHHDEAYACGVETFIRREPYPCGSERQCKRVRHGSGKQARYERVCEDVPRKCFRDVPEEHPRTCTRPVEAPWCDYLTQEWLPVRSERIEGDAHLGLRYPDLVAHTDFERVLTSAAYSMTLVHAGGPHDVVVERAEYDRWNPGDPVVLQIEGVGGVLGFRRPDPPGR